jgi:hypothetical protein
MAIILLQNNTAKNWKAKNLVVSANNAADARTFAASHFNGDSSWADATATTLAGGTLDDPTAMTGYVWSITIEGGAAQTVDPVTVSVIGVTDLDATAALLVTALNATADIANASYAAPNLTLSSIADGIGDATFLVTVTPPSGNTKTDLSALFTGAHTEGGIAGAALVLALVADTEVTPEVLVEV